MVSVLSLAAGVSCRPRLAQGGIMTTTENGPGGKGLKVAIAFGIGSACAARPIRLLALFKTFGSTERSTETGVSETKFKASVNAFEGADAEAFLLLVRAHIVFFFEKSVTKSRLPFCERKQRLFVRSKLAAMNHNQTTKR